jgi:hypothetical protein
MMLIVIKDNEMMLIVIKTYGAIVVEDDYVRNKIMIIILICII